MLKRFILDQTAATVFASVAVTLTAVHPFIHHFEGGVLDSMFEYLYVASLDAMNRGK